MADDFTWRDGERLVRFGEGVAAEAPELLAAEGFGACTLLTTDRAAASAPAIAERAQKVVRVPSGRWTRSRRRSSPKCRRRRWWASAADASWTPRRRSPAPAACAARPSRRRSRGPR